MSAEIAIDQEQLKSEIDRTKSEIESLDAKVKELEAKLPPNEELMTHVELGFIQTQGNTKTDTFNLEIDMKKNWDKNQVTYFLDGQYASDRENETKNKFATELEYAYSFTDKLSATYLAGYKQDKFSGFNYQAYTGPGIRYQLVASGKHEFSLEGSILYSIDDIEDSNLDAAGEVIEYPNPDNIPISSITYGNTDKYTSYRAKGVYGWQMLENLKFDQELSYRAEFSNSETFFVCSKSALSSKISEIFSAGISYKLDYVNTPPEGKQYTDETFTANLIIDF